MDKAPDAFRTISEVADDLDIPQHVLRFWETRFAQIKPMKRSGGRRYYRPDDVDLLAGIRRLLYGEGYTIRGVQRILKEHGIESVQRLADASAVASFGAIEEAVGQSILEQDDDDGRAPSISMTTIMRARRESAFPPAPKRRRSGDPTAVRRKPDSRRGRPRRRGSTSTRLEGVLQDLIACRQLLDARAEGRLTASSPRNRHVRPPVRGASRALRASLIEAKGTASERGAARLAH